MHSPAGHRRIWFSDRIRRNELPRCFFVGTFCATVFFVVLLFPVFALADAVKVESLGRRLNVEDWNQNAVGKLHWRGGLELTANRDPFGGLSGLQIEDQGARLLAVTDEGHWLEAELLYDEAGNLSGLASARMGPLFDRAGEPLIGKELQDAEAMARLQDGSLLVSFERKHRIYRYLGPEALKSAAAPFPFPEGAMNLPNNKGLEALAAWPDGRILAVAEGRRDDGDHDAYLYRDGDWEKLSVASVDGHRPTGASVLPNGDLVLVERRFSPVGGLSIRLRRVAEEDVQAGASLTGEEVARLTPPLTIDNMEGIAAWRGKDERTVIAILSDDNFNPLQRTLLLLFELSD